MKPFNIERALVKAAPKDSAVDTAFTTKVMDSLRMQPGQVMRKNKGRSFASWLIHLPKFALIILAVATLFTISGVAYAVVETIKIQKSVEIQNHDKNNNGREQLTVGFNNCEAQKKVGTTYEVKKDSGLSSEEATKTLEARCELDTIADWLKKDPATKPILEQDRFLAGMSVKIIGKVSDITSDEITIDFETRQESFAFPANARIVEENEVRDRNSLQPGDSILLFSPYYLNRGSYDKNANVILFKLRQQPIYYSTIMQWYVGARGACTNNPDRNCLLHNNINSVFLSVTRGGASPSINDIESGKISRDIQGRVTEYTNTYVKIDVGGGVIYTIKTLFNIIEKYNRTTVYGLASYDLVYADTDPETLKIAIGDSLDINYAETVDQTSPTIPWQNVYGISLMVERTAKDMNVLTKY